MARVGFELLHAKSDLGISQLGADWFIKWTTEIANSTYINMSRFEGGLGRIMFVAGALEYEKPFLGPLYRFLSIHPRGSIRRVPPYVSFILHYLSRQIAGCRHFLCASSLESIRSAPRVDAQASADRTGIGGWMLAYDQDGIISLGTSYWFSHEITRHEFPWVFERGDNPSHIISSLESLAALVALKLFFPSSTGHSKKFLSFRRGRTIEGPGRH